MSDLRKKLRTTLKRLCVEAAERAHTNQEIIKRLLHESANIRESGFRVISGTDMRCLFDCYDELYFDDQLNLALQKTPLGFRVSSRMIQAGGKTSFWRKNRNSPIQRFEIAISATLLSQTFTDGQRGRSIRVTGLKCHTRLDALMRVMEHELVHLAELLAWNSSSCSQDRFQAIAWRVFGHTDYRHALITPRERAAEMGVSPGAHVRFERRGQTLQGIVNRVTRRATVLVPADGGDRFSDGNTYHKYYVPVAKLEPIDDVG